MKRPVIITASIAGAVLIFLLAISQTGGDVMQYSVLDLKNKIDNGDNMLILDVRTPMEYSGELGHIENSIVIPIYELEQRVGELEQYRDREIVAICRTQNRSRVAASILKDAGFDNIAYVYGGMVDWNIRFGNPQGK